MSLQLDTPALSTCVFGTRMTADEFLALPESPIHYELIDGVVVMAPAASFGHQDIAGELLYQIRRFLETHPIGRAVADVDVKLREGLVYRPDLVFLSAEKAARVRRGVLEPPDLIVEILSPESRQRDTRTKRDDYQSAGVGEYWLIDPQDHVMRFLVLRSGVYQDAPSGATHFASTILAGMRLDLARIQKLF